MRKSLKLLCSASILFFLSSYLMAVQMDIKLKLFRGIKEGVEKSESKVVTSYTLTPFFTGKIIPKTREMDEKKELKKIFNLKNVELLNEANLRYNSFKAEKVFQVVSINGGNYLIILTPRLTKGGYKFKVEVYEGIKQKTQNNLLDVELTLPRRNIAVVGFSDSKEIPYFLSFRVTGVILGGPVSGVVMGGVVKGVEKGVKGKVEGGVVSGVVGGVASKEIEKPLRVGGEIKPPKIVKKVMPIYPKVCKEKGIEGTVILEATTDIHGNIQKVKILRPAHPALDKAAIEAVKQWKYEPYIKDGKLRPVTFSITVSFKLAEEAKKKRKVELREPVRINVALKPPKLIKKVIPEYPKECKEKGVEGTVILEATLDKKGNIKKVKVLKSAHPELDKSAIKAVKQWKYEPYIIDGKPHSVIFTITVTFKLDK